MPYPVFLHRLVMPTTISSREMPHQRIDGQYILSKLQEQVDNNWLVDFDNVILWQLTQEKIVEIKQFQHEYRITPRVLLLEANYLSFVACFLAATIAEVPIFLGHPHWQQVELQQSQNLLKPHIIWSNQQNIRPILNEFSKRDSAVNNLIGISTGGSSGKIRFALHTPDSLTASVKGFADYFDIETIDCCCILPLYHVSGLMQLWRSLITGGRLAITSYKDIKQGFIPNIIPQSYFLSLVPTQLQFLIERNPDWLSQFRTILLGGAPAWRSLLNRAKKSNLPIATTYGMTETASGISYLKPRDFCQRNYSSGKVLPHAKVKIINHQGDVLEENSVGTIQIWAKSLYYGYYPYFSKPQSLITDDLGFIDTAGFLHIVGRNSQKIVTGGENVYPQEVEAAILATKLVKDVCVIGVDDAKWGQAVIALFVPLDKSDRVTAIRQDIQKYLSKYKQPKHWLQVSSLQRDSKGKINYSLLTKKAKKLLEQQK